MDASALIFVALAVAWAAYLIPKALEHHEESVRSRTVDRFSRSMRVIARREPVGRGKAELVTPGRPSSRPAPAAKVRTPVTPARRRRRVLSLVLLANAVVIGLAVAAVLTWAWVAVPAVLLLTWLVACRLMVRRERVIRRRPARPRAETRPVAEEPSETELEEATAAVAEGAEHVVMGHELMPDDVTAEHAPVSGTWDPQSVPLPTYVSKPAAPRRSVRQIDLDSTGVWSSGPRESDSQLVRDADEAARTARARAEARRHSS